MKKRVLALVMALALCVGLLPLTAAADTLEPSPQNISVTPTGFIPLDAGDIRQIGANGNYMNRNADGSYTDSGEKAEGFPTGTLVSQVRWDNNPNHKDFELYGTAYDKNGQKTRTVNNGDTRARKEEYDNPDNPGWSVTTVGNQNECVFWVNVIGSDAQKRILDIANQLLKTKFIDQGMPEWNNLFTQVNTELKPLTGQDVTVPLYSDGVPTDEEAKLQKKVTDPLDSAIFRLHDEYGNNPVPETSAKLNADEEKQLLQGVAELGGNGYSAPLLADRETLSVEVTGEMYSVETGWIETEKSEPVVFEITVDSLGKKFTAEPEKPCPKGGSHNYVWEKDAYEHKQYCTKCGDVKVESARHTPTNIKVEAGHEATCLKEAWVSFDCSVCGYHREHVTCDISTVGLFPSLAAYGALGHDFSGPLKYIGGSKCSSEEEGSHAVSCTRCGATDTLNRVPHAWATHTVSNGNCADPNDPTIIEGTCACGAELHLEKPREHDYIDWPYDNKDANCTEPGQTNTKKCRFCDSKTFDVTEALGHDWVTDEETKADCEHEGHILAHCSRCDATKDENIERKSETGQHTWTKNITTQPGCETDGYYHGEVCSVCGATRNENDVERIEPLGHLPHTELKSIGRTKTQPGQYAVVMEIELYESTTTCTRCHQVLKTNFFKVYTTQRPAKYQIVEGKKAQLTDMSKGIHVKGNMANDGGAFFRETIRNAMKEKALQETKQFQKTPANSFIITLNEDFLAELADGAYDFIIINGNEFWPMTITVAGGKITALEDMVAPDDIPEMTLEEMNDFIRAHGGDPDGVEVIYLAGQPGVAGEVNGSALTCTVQDAPANAVLIAARYDHDRLTDMKTFTLAAGDTQKTVTMKGTGDKFKLMLVDPTTYAPLCKAWTSTA